MTTALAPALKLPPVLASLDLKLARATQVSPPPEIWPEGAAFTKAEQPEAIAKVLIQSELHDRLVNARLCYLFREKIDSAGRPRITVSAAARGKLQYLTGFDLVLEFNHTAWLQLTPEQKLAAVDHALQACARDLDTGAYFVELPDVSEFSAVVARWGLWTSPLRGFGVAIQSAQIELFVPYLSQAADEPAPRDLAEEARNRLKRGGK